MKKRFQAVRMGALLSLATLAPLSIASAGLLDFLLKPLAPILAPIVNPIITPLGLEPLNPPTTAPILTQILEPILTPITDPDTNVPSLDANARQMKLLVLTADGTEPSFASIQAILKQLGVPYDAVVLTETGGQLPPLQQNQQGSYQGIILATGNLVTCKTTPCSIALPEAGWEKLDQYAMQYGVRTLAYYTFPDPRYGLMWTGEAQTGGSASFAPGSAEAFPDLTRTGQIPVEFAYVYKASPIAQAGETTTPVLTMDGATIAVLHKKADNREYLALTFDNSQYLTHSMAFGYGLVKWVTNGVFIGERKFYYSPQIDDLFLANDLFDETDADCRPSGFQVDPTVDPSSGCPSIRTTGADLDAIKAWQDATAASGAGSIKTTMAFNGLGVTAEGDAPTPDTLASAAARYRTNFYWVSHTFSHEHLDCYQPVPNSGVCDPASYSESYQEISRNANIGNQLNLVQDKPSMVTPNISGLENPEFLRAAESNGIRYLVSDSSKLASDFLHNTAVWSPIRPSILLIPRRPTNIFYNVYTPALGVPGSATDEYNYFYGPDGISRVGGPGGPPFFPTEQSYEGILNREAEIIVRNMLRGEVYPLMFHQANLVAYDGVNSLFTDLSNVVLAKIRSLTPLPVKSLSQSSIARVALDRMDFNQSGVTGTISPGVGMILKVSRNSKIPVTGVCAGDCDGNGGEPVSYFNARRDRSTYIPLPQ
jgi:hypothetical protein